MIFMDVPWKIKNKRYKELNIESLEVSLRSRIGKVISTSSLQSLPTAIEDFISDADKYRKEIISLRNKYVFNLGSSSKFGAEYIIKLL